MPWRSNLSYISRISLCPLAAPKCASATMNRNQRVQFAMGCSEESQGDATCERRGAERSSTKSRVTSEPAHRGVRAISVGKFPHTHCVSRPGVYVPVRTGTLKLISVISRGSTLTCNLVTNKPCRGVELLSKVRRWLIALCKVLCT